jgi:hypothetical protein
MESIDVSNKDHNFITTRTCHSCGRRGPTVVFACKSTPVYAGCAGCCPEEFEAVAKRDVDEWLEGGSPMRFG